MAGWRGIRLPVPDSDEEAHGGPGCSTPMSLTTRRMLSDRRPAYRAIVPAAALRPVVLIRCQSPIYLHRGRISASRTRVSPSWRSGSHGRECGRPTASRIGERHRGGDRDAGRPIADLVTDDVSPERPRPAGAAADESTIDDLIRRSATGSATSGDTDDGSARVQQADRPARRQRRTADRPGEHPQPGRPCPGRPGFLSTRAGSRPTGSTGFSHNEAPASSPVMRSGDGLADRRDGWAGQPHRTGPSARTCIRRRRQAHPPAPADRSGRRESGDPASVSNCGISSSPNSGLRDELPGPRGCPGSYEAFDKVTKTASDDARSLLLGSPVPGRAQIGSRRHQGHVGVPGGGEQPAPVDDTRGGGMWGPERSSRLVDRQQRAPARGDRYHADLAFGRRAANPVCHVRPCQAHRVVTTTASRT